MTRVDQFESVFRSASKEVYHPSPIPIEHVHVVDDLDGKAAADFMARLQGFLSVLGDGVRWTSAEGDEARDVPRLLKGIEQQQPDLVCTYRNLFSDSWRYPYSLGEHVDVLTQVVTCPVLVLPHPSAEGSVAEIPPATEHVLAMGGHLAGDHSLVDWGLKMTAPAGNLQIAHIEDDRAFERYIDVISKIPTLETDEARVTIMARLLKEPREYIESVARAVAAEKLGVTVLSEVRVGHRLAEYRRLIAENRVDMLVMHTKDEDQLAMHGLAYPLAVELRETPLLLL